jgi:hypothetical protein
VASLRREIYDAHAKLAQLRAELAAITKNEDRAVVVARESDVAGTLADFQYRLRGLG